MSGCSLVEFVTSGIAMVRQPSRVNLGHKNQAPGRQFLVLRLNVVLQPGDGMDQGHGAVDLAERRADRMHMALDDSRHHASAAEIDLPRQRTGCLKYVPIGSD